MVENKDNAINNKRESKKNKKPKKPDFKNFIKTFGTQVFTFIISLFLGAVVLYSARAAQTNLLPTCLNEQPFNDITADIKSIDVDFNIFGSGDSIKSTKINFPVEENSNLIDKGMFFKSLKSMMDPKNPSATAFSLFFATIFQKMIAMHFSVSSGIFKTINSSLSELFIILLGPFLYLFSIIIPFIVDMWYFLYVWFFNLDILNSQKHEMRVNANSGKRGPAVIGKALIWKKESSQFWSIIYMIISICLFLFSILPTLGLVFAMLFLLMYSIIPYTAHLKSYFATDSTKSYGVLSVFKDIFINKTYIFMYIISIFLIMDANSFLSNYSAFLAFIGCLILYFFTSMYDSNKPTAVEHITPGIGGYEVPSRHCKPPPPVVQPSMMDRVKIAAHDIKVDAKEEVKVVPEVMHEMGNTVKDLGDVALDIIEIPIDGIMDIAETPITLAMDGVKKIGKEFTTLGKTGIKDIEKSSELATDAKKTK